MRSAVAIIMAVLGTILVLSGAGALWATALVRPRDAAGATTPAVDAGSGTRLSRTAGVVSQVPAPERLIIWGVVLLGLSAVAAGAITFSATATAGAH